MMVVIGIISDIYYPRLVNDSTMYNPTMAMILPKLRSSVSAQLAASGSEPTFVHGPHQRRVSMTGGMKLFDSMNRL